MTLPVSSSVPGTVAHPGRRPHTVSAAFWLVLASALLGVFDLVVVVVQFSDPAALTAAAAAAGDDTLSAAAARRLLDAAFAVTVVSGVVGIVLPLPFAAFLLRGAGWARVVVTVIAGLSLVSVPSSLPRDQVELPFETVDVALGLLAAALGVATIVATWAPASNAWFRAVRASRAER